MKTYIAFGTLPTLPQHAKQDSSVDVLSLRAFNPHVRGSRKEAVLVEAGLAERQMLLDGAPADMAVAVLGGEHDGLAQLARWSSGHADLDALHLVCHGAPGRLMLGTLMLDRRALAEPPVQDALAAIGMSLRVGGAVLLYSCNVAQGDEGRAFVAELALALGVSVFAASGLVGATAGASWVLYDSEGRVSPLALAWPSYRHTLTIASTTTTFSSIPAGVNTSYNSLGAGFATPGYLSKDDVASTGWDVSSQSSNSTLAFIIRGIGTSGNGDGDDNALRFQSSDVDYVIFKSNINGFYFDLSTFRLRNDAGTTITVQAIDSSGALQGSAVPFSFATSTAYNTVSLVGNSDFQHIYGFKVTFSSGTDSPFFDNLIVANIGIPSLPTTTVSTAKLSDDTGSSNSDFVTSVASQTITGTLSAVLASGEKVQVSYDNGSTWTNASSFSTGSSSWSTSTTLAGSGTFLARVANQDGYSNAFSHSYTFDNTAPATPSTPDLIAADDSGINNDNVTSVTTPTFTGTAESGTVVTLYDSNGTTVLGSTTASGGSWTITSSALAPTTHTLTVKSVDLAGNVSASLPLSVTIDNSAPTGLALSVTTATTSTSGSGAALATLSASDSTAITYALATGNGTNDANNGSFTISGNSLNVGGASLGAGTYKIYLSATDLAGNISYLAQTFTVNTVPTVSSIVRAGGASATVGASATTATYTVTFSESVTGVDAGDFVLTPGGSASGSVSSVTGSGTTYTVTVNGLAGDGTLRLDLKASGTGIQNGASVAINGGYTSGQTYSLDHTAPAAPSTPHLASGDDSGGSNTDNITKVNQPSFSGTAESGSTVTLYEGNTVLGMATATGGIWTIVPTAPLANGTHQITAKAVDAAGNVSAASGALSVNIDTSAPVGLALSATTAAVASASPGATLATLTSTDDNSVTYALAVGDGFNDADNAAFAIAGNSFKVNNIQLSAGVYHVYLSATDAAGNVSYLVQTMTVQNIPVVTSIVRAGGASSAVASGASSVDYTVTFSESVTGVDMSDFVLTSSNTASGTISGISGSGSTYIITVSGLTGDGTLRLDLKASGTGIQNGGSVAIGGGFVAGASYTLDHTAPAAPSLPLLAALDDTGISNTDNITKVTTPTFTGTAEAGSTVTLYEGNTVLGTAVATGGVWSITSLTLTQGTHTLTVKTTDAAGNTSAASSALTLTVDTAAAAPTGLTLAAGSDSGVAGDGITRFNTPTIGGNGEAYAAVTLYDTDGTTVIGTTTAGANGAWSIVVNTTLSEGPHTLKAAQTDLAGNVSLSSGLVLTIDTQAPVAPGAPTLDPASDTGTLGDNRTLTATPVIKGTALANAVVKLYDTNGTTVLGTTTADGAGNWSITSSSLAAGIHTLSAKQQDVAGNESAASVPLSLTIEAPPTPPSAPTTTVDGVQVQSETVTLPGGGSGTLISIPVVTPGRVESSGNAGVADIPLATSGQGNILLAQLPAGFGLSAVGGVSQPAGDPLKQLIAAIVAATPGHTSSDQGHLTGNGVDFLSQLAQSTPLLVQTITPSAAATPSGTLTLTGTSSAVQRTALVIDATHLPTGSKLALNAVDFAAIIGSADVSINSSGQVVTGDAASQTFTVASASNSVIFAGGGGDTLVFGQVAPSAAPTPLRAAGPGEAGTTLLHGGLGSDVAVIAGNVADYTVEQHEGYLVVAAKAQPQQQALLINVESLKFADTTMTLEQRDAQTAIAGLYREVLHRQADYLGFDFWATAEKNGVSLGHIALSVIMSPESQGLSTGAFNGDNAHDIELLYQSLFGRHSDAEGFAFWSNAMKHGVSLESVATSFMTSAEMVQLHTIGVAQWDFVLG